MSLRKLDMQQVRRAMRVQGLDHVELSLAPGRIVLRKNPSRPQAPAPVAYEEAAPPPAVASSGRAPAVVRASVPGRLHWACGAAPDCGGPMAEGDVLATVLSGDRRIEVTSPQAGTLIHVQPFEEGEFVEYNQWLATIAD